MKQPNNQPDSKISTFLSNQTVLTLATGTAEYLHCCMCYYAYLSEKQLLVFKSKPTTKHIQFALKNLKVAGAVRQDVLNKVNIQGVQFNGNLLINPDDELLSESKKVYYGKYPFALAVPGEIWIIKLDYIKLTENKLGLMSEVEWTG